MISASFWHDENKRCCGFLVEGHAESAPYGSDLICAGVSALVVATENSLEKHGFKLECHAKDGYVELKVYARSAEEWLQITAIIRTLQIGLEAIEASQDGKYLEVRNEEVSACSQ